MTTTIISSMIRNAQAAPAFTHVTDTEEHIRRVQPNTAHEMKYLNLRELTVKDVLNDGPDEIYSLNQEGVFPGPGSPGTNSRIAANVIAMNSRVCDAGSPIILIKDAAKPVKDSNGDTVMTEQNAGYITAIPAKFNKVIDGQDAQESPLPVYWELMDRAIAPSYFFRISLTRRQMKMWDKGQLESSLLYSIIAGVGRAADHIVLESVMRAGIMTPSDPEGSAPILNPPSAFTLQKAAAAGVRVNDLRAIIGTNGYGASFNPAGELTAAGIRAELSSETSATLIGDWSKVAVGILEDITMTAQKVNFTDGSLVLTAIVNASALIPQRWETSLPMWTIESDYGHI